MNEIVNTQTFLFIKAIEIGILLGMLYDLVRIFRKIIKHPNWLVQIEDILYWGIGIAISFGVLYIHNFANIRFFVFIGMVLGGIFYLSTFSILFMKVATWLIDFLRYIIVYIIKMVLIPIGWLISMIKIPLYFVLSKLRQLNQYKNIQQRKVRRKWYYIQSDVKAGIKVKQNKHIYKIKKND